MCTKLRTICSCLQPHFLVSPLPSRRILLVDWIVDVKMAIMGLLGSWHCQQGGATSPRSTVLSKAAVWEAKGRSQLRDSGGRGVREEP